MWKLLASIGIPGRFLIAGNAARDRRDFREAARHYRSYLWRQPQDGVHWVQYGHSLKETGHYAEASEAYFRAQALMPLDADLQLQIGHLNKITGQIRAAIASYRRALELDPTLHPAREELDRLQSVTEQQFAQDWKLSVDVALNDSTMRIKALQERVAELEANQGDKGRSKSS